MTEATQYSIFVVDDESINRKVLTRVLSNEGYQVWSANSGEALLTAVAHHPPDLVLLDVMLPDMDGYTVSRRLKADPATADIPVLFISALEEVEEKVKAFTAGGVDYITKPLRAAEVLARVRTHLSLRAMRQQLEARNRQLAEAQASLQAYSEKLEERVAARTAELREAQAKLLRQERLAVVGQLAGGIGHELRNPLSTMSNAIYYLRTILSQPNPKAWEMLDILDQQVATSNQIITTLLDYARGRPPRRTLLDLNELLKDVLAETVVPDHVTVQQEFDATLPPIAADPDQLQTVFGNLVRNAIQAMPPPQPGENTAAQLILHTHPTENGAVCVRCSDTGEGIAPEHQKKLFEPLFTTKRSGIGLGLALVRMLVAGHKGMITVDSEVGKGSTFTVELPIEFTPTTP